MVSNTKTVGNGRLPAQQKTAVDVQQASSPGVAIRSHLEGPTMAPDETNQKEWDNPQNWSDRWIGLYFSKRDSRLWVPKRNPRLGWTLNLAHPAGAVWLFGLFLGIILLIIAGCVASHLV